LSDYFDNDTVTNYNKPEPIYDKGTPENIYGTGRFKMNPGAAEFVPGSSVAPLARTRTTTRDAMIENLEARLAILEMLNILPVVEAVKV